MSTLNRLSIGLGLALVLGPLAIAETESQPRLPEPGRNAFLKRSVSTTKQLVAQAKANPRIMDSYTRHFHMSREEVVAYLSTLRPVRLTDSAEYTVFSVPGSGEFKSRQHTLKRGELVFVDQSGNPVLLARCGNPLGRGPAQPESVSTEAAVAVMAPEMAPITAPEAELVPLAPLVLQPAPPIVPELITAAPAPPPVTTGGQVQPFALPLLLALPVLGGSFGGGGGGGGGVIPEPATVLILGAGVAALAARRRRKQA